MNQITVGVITVSDRARGIYDDLGGPALKEAVLRYGWQILAEAIVPDDIGRIRETIRSFSAQGCGLILTTGGTGAAPRDVTPEAIRAAMRVELPGFGEVMRAGSMKLTPNAILSRSLAAIVDQSLVIALPGKPPGCGGLPRVRGRRDSTFGADRARDIDLLLTQPFPDCRQEQQAVRQQTQERRTRPPSQRPKQNGAAKCQGPRHEGAGQAQPGKCDTDKYESR
jgi:molybdopterin adenylyltransferase